MAAGSDADLTTCARLLAAAPGPLEVDLLIQGMDQALQGRRLRRTPATLTSKLDELLRSRSDNLTLLRLGLRMGMRRLRSAPSKSSKTAKPLRAIAFSSSKCSVSSAKQNACRSCCGVSAATRSTRFAQPLFAVYSPSPTVVLRTSCSRSMRSFLRTYGRWRRACSAAGLPPRARFCARSIQARLIPRRLPWINCAASCCTMTNNFVSSCRNTGGASGPASAGANARASTASSTSSAPASASPSHGRQLFQKHCATCHTLFGEGNKVGPDLTGADRKDLEFLVTSTVDPSAVVRKEYLAYVVDYD